MIEPFSTTPVRSEAHHPWRCVDRGLWIRKEGSGLPSAYREASLRGALQVQSTDRLAQALEEIMDEGAEWLVLDMTRVASFDPAAARALAATASYLENRGGWLKLRHPRRHIGQALEIVGLGRLVMHDD